MTSFNEYEASPVATRQANKTLAILVGGGPAQGSTA